MDFSCLIGRKVSVVITGKDDKTESYSGIVEKVDDGFLFLDPNNPSFTIEKMLFRTDIIKSVWVYK